MTTTMALEVLADPLGVVVGLVADVEPRLERAAIIHVVSRVAGGRAKRRRLAQALLDRPAVLARWPIEIHCTRLAPAHPVRTSGPGHGRFRARLFCSPRAQRSRAGRVARSRPTR